MSRCNPSSIASETLAAIQTDMAEPPSRKPQVPRRKDLEEKRKALEEAEAARYRPQVEPVEAVQHSKVEAEDKQEPSSVVSKESIQHSPLPSPLLPSAPPSSDFIFGFNFKGQPWSVRSPDAVGINGLSSGVTTGGYFEPSSSEPPRPTSRRSAFEEERDRAAFDTSERPASEEDSEHLAFEEELERSALENDLTRPAFGTFGPEEVRKDLTAEEESNNLASEELEHLASEASQSSAPVEASKLSPFDQLLEDQLRHPELFDRPPEESHKIIQINDSAQVDHDKPSSKLYLQFSDLTYTVCKKESRCQQFKGAILPGYRSKRPPPKPLRLLNGISGEARDGEILAVMGPSGSGKSTLIDALAQRIDAVKGTMTLNGNHFSERLLRNISAYVMQA